MAGFTAPLRSTVLELTNRCNLRCVHCASGSGKPRPGELATGRWLDLLDEVAALGGEEVTLIGGEVFLHPDWPVVARHVTDLGMRLILITNGLLVDDRGWTLVNELDVHVLGVSLDGATPDAYRAVRGVDGFDRAFGLLRRLAATGHPRVNAITTFSRRNLDQFDLLADLLQNTGITWQVQLASHAGPRAGRDLLITTEEYRWLARRMTEVLLSRQVEQLWLCPMDDFGYFPLDPTEALIHQHWRGCQAARSVIGVRSNGDLLGCLSLGDAFVVANVREQSLIEAWRSPELFLDLRHKTRRLRGACRACPEARRCRAGCSNIAHSATGTIFDNPYCLRRLETDAILAELAGTEVK